MVALASGRKEQVVDEGGARESHKGGGASAVTFNHWTLTGDICHCPQQGGKASALV